MFSIQDLPIIERPREKLIRYGSEKLSEEELLAIILGSGNRKANVLKLSQNLSKFIKSVDISNLNFEDFNHLIGMGPDKICKIIACIELGKRFLLDKKNKIYLKPEQIWEELKDIRQSKKEHFIVLFLDSRNQEIKKEIISVGTVNNSLVHPREVFEPAVRYLTSHIIIAHNHPSQITTPSEADIKITKKLQNAGKILGIEVIDHIIVGSKDFYSFKDHHLI